MIAYIYLVTFLGDCKKKQMCYVVIGHENQKQSLAKQLSEERNGLEQHGYQDL